MGIVPFVFFGAAAFCIYLVVKRNLRKKNLDPDPRPLSSDFPDFDKTFSIRFDQTQFPYYEQRNARNYFG